MVPRRREIFYVSCPLCPTGSLALRPDGRIVRHSPGYGCVERRHWAGAVVTLCDGSLLSRTVALERARALAHASNNGLPEPSFDRKAALAASTGSPGIITRLTSG